MATVVHPGVADHYGTEPGDPERALRLGGVGQHLAAQQVTEFVEQALAGADLDGKRVCLVVPDGTRTCPLPLLLGAAHRALTGRATTVTVVIALGTHQGMSEEHLARHLGYEPGQSERTYPGWRILNHESWRPETFTSLGRIRAERLAELTGGLLSDKAVEVKINRHVAEADVAVVVGPVFPHEVVGFSGGNKYYFPGVSGQELIDVSHWVGALITSAQMLGTPGVTPVRALINEAATLIPAERLALCLVVASGTDTLHAVAFGAPEDA
jgi:nickel-dependent lactate racemase